MRGTEPIRRDIQGLRAVAVLLVILAHVGAPGMSGGFVGVDVFFVVSGFVICSLLFREVKRTGRIRLGTFYARRARRILPAATVVLVTTTVFAAVALPVSRLDAILTEVRWSGMFMANLHFSRVGTDYSDLDQTASPVLHFWSLAVEEQFYLFWPVVLCAVLVVMRRARPVRRDRVVAAVVVAILVGSFVLAVVLTTRTPTSAYFASGARAWELATGALLAAGARYLTVLRPVARRILGAGGLLAIAWSAMTFDETTRVTGPAGLLPVLGTAAVLASGTGDDIARTRLLTAAPMRWVGDLSYSLYLWHWPVLVLAAPEFLAGDLSHGPLVLPDAVVVVLATFALSTVSFYVVERPFRLGQVPLSRGLSAVALWPVTLGSVAIAGAWASGFADASLQRRIDDAEAYYEGARPGRAPVLSESVKGRLAAALDLADDNAPIPPHLRNLRNLGRDLWQFTFTCNSAWDATTTRICPAGDLEAPTSMVVYGDSHAGMWLPPLAKFARKHHYRMVPLVKYGCAPFDVPQRSPEGYFPECPAFRDWAADRIEEIDPAVVVLAARSLWLVDLPEEQQDAAWQRGVESVLRSLARPGRRVVVLSHVSTLPFRPAECATDPDATVRTCVAPEESIARRGNELMRAAVARTGAEYVDVTGLVCLRGRCPLFVDDTITYRDSAHISMTWSREIAAEFGERLGLPDGAVASRRPPGERRP